MLVIREAGQEFNGKKQTDNGGRSLKTLDSMENGKAAGPDGVVKEMLSLLDDFGITRITQLANNIYQEGHFPVEMCKYIFITLYQRNPVQ